MLKKVSIFWIIVFALLITSAVPLGIMAVQATQTTENGVEAEQRAQLVARVDAQAQAIDGRFLRFQTATVLAAAQARKLLITDAPMLTPEQVKQRMEKYQREGAAEIKSRDDAEKDNPPDPKDSIRYNDLYPFKLGVLGLDNYYTTVFAPQNKNSNRLSNVFLNNLTELTPAIQYDIAVTEDLNRLFESILDNRLGSQWIYLTTAEGMMRLYPWAPNSHYPVNWQPQTINFYTGADGKNDPERKPVWTLPYNDFAGAGIMVTNSVPIYDGDTLVAVMSHDMLIEELRAQVLDVKIGEQGSAFLMDTAGNVVAIQGYDVKNTPLGQEVKTSLKSLHPDMGAVMDKMLATKEPGITNYIDKNNQEWLVVYATIPSTNWHLGLMQPRSEIIRPALDIRNQITPIAAFLIIVVVGVSVMLARGITHPLRLLTKKAEDIEREVQTEQGVISVVSRDSLSYINGPSEINRLVGVFSQMVNALQERMRELDSVYIMGQTITANVEYEQTLHTLLTAVREVVNYDAAEIGMVDGEELVVQAWLGKSDWRNTTGRRQRIGYGPMGLIARDKTPMLISTIHSVDDVQKLINQPEYDGKLIIEGRVKSLLGIPLFMKDTLLGVLMMVDRTEGRFSEADKRKLIKLAAQASIAISNAMQVRKRESVLKKQIQDLQIEIDEARKAKQVNAIVESDFFKDLQSKADSMRSRAKPGRKSAESENQNPQP